MAVPAETPYGLPLLLIALPAMIFMSVRVHRSLTNLLVVSTSMFPLLSMTMLLPSTLVLLLLSHLMLATRLSRIPQKCRN